MASDNVIEFTRYSKAEINETLAPIEGKTIIGTLDQDLLIAYIELANHELVLAELSEFYKKRYIEKAMGNLLGDTDMGNFHEIMQAFTRHELFETEEEAVELYRRVSEWEELRAIFWHKVRITYNAWNDYVELRRDFRLVSIGKRFRK